MKRHSLAIALIAVLCALCVMGCSSSKESSQEQPDTQSTTQETLNTSAKTEVSTTATSATKATQKTTKNKTSKNQSSRKQSATQPSTSPTAPKNIPPNSISGANINPAMGSIANRVSNDIASMEVTSISLSEKNIDLSVGDKIEIDVTYYPEGALYKLCTAKLSTKCAEISSKTNKSVTLRGVTAGTGVLVVTSQNGHKASCNITVKQNESITDDTKLSHKELCTVENVNRWTAEISAECAATGMTKKDSLKGVDIAIDTSDNADKKKSYNDVKSEYLSTVRSQLDALIDGDAKDYVYNCYSEPKGGSEYYINVVISNAN